MHQDYSTKEPKPANDSGNDAGRNRGLPGQWNTPQTVRATMLGVGDQISWLRPSMDWVKGKFAGKPHI